MADLIRSKEGALEKTRSRSNHIVEELDPSSGWTEDPNNYYLLIDLPHFKKEEIKIQAEGSNVVTISGERRVRDNRFVYFEKNYRVPENADTQRTSGKLEGGLLAVTIPKQPMAEKNGDQPEAEKASTGNNVNENASHENPTRTETEEPKEERNGMVQNGKESCSESGNLFSRGITMVSKNKSAIFMAIIAFSLGMLASRNVSLSLYKEAAKIPS